MERFSLMNSLFRPPIVSIDISPAREMEGLLYQNHLEKEHLYVA